PCPDVGRAGADRDDGFVLHRGAHALYPNGPGAEVARRLGIDLDGVSPPTKGALGLSGGSAGVLPQGPWSLLRSSLLSGRDRLRLPLAARRLTSADPATVAHLTVAGWLDSLGLTGAVRRVAEMLVRLATYGADLDLMSADVAAHQLGLGGVRYLHRGFVGLAEDLRATATAAGAVAVTARVRAVRSGPRSVTVVADGRTVTARSAIVAVGSPSAAGGLLVDPPPAWRDLPAGPAVACLDLALDGVPDGPPVLLGLDEPVYAIRHAPPARLAPPGGAVVHVVRYLRASDAIDPRSGRAELESLARRMGIDLDRAVRSRYLHRMAVVGTTPTPDRGGLVGRPDIAHRDHPRLFVAGDWVGPTGYLADAALVSAERAGRAAAELARRPAPVGATT
ncbi:MAG TPA: FAD-dependent oxidoreductase, partial [Acidimicrobiales bacterium]|nr:FAD-dependent oxidoreductase [Acidimicrobiales bacterium]